MDAPPDSSFVEQAAVYWIVELPLLTDPADYYEIKCEPKRAQQAAPLPRMDVFFSVGFAAGPPTPWSGFS